MSRKTTIALTAAGIIIIGIILFQVFSGMEKEPPGKIRSEPAKYVLSEKVKYRDYYAKTTVYGRVSAKNKIEVYSEVTGEVLKRKPEFDVGNYFKKGRIMAKIDAEELRLNLFSQKSEMINLLARILPDIKADFPGSYPQWDEYLKNFEIEGETQPLPEPKSSKEKYYLAARNIYKIYYAIRSLELRIDKYEIRAPFNGTVTESYIEPGTLVRTGQKLGAFVGSGNYELLAAVNEDEAKFIGVGAKAIVYSENGVDSWIGRVVRIGDNIDPVTQTVSVFIRVSGKGLKDGMYLKSDITGSKLENVFKMPRNALVDETYINCVSGDSLLIRKKVDVVREDERDAYVRGVDTLTLAIVEPLVEVPTGTKVKPYLEK